MGSASRADYGIDQPYLTLVGFLVGGVFVVAGLVASLRGSPLALSGPLLLLGFLGLSLGFWFLLASWVFKPADRKRMMEQLPLRGDELVIDVGCGRGAILMEAAKRVPEGLAVGIDIWSSRYESGNTTANTTRNARAEAVLDRVVLVAGDARKLPFKEGTFDVAFSRAVFVNFSRNKDFDSAVTEMARVVRPGGQVRLGVIDIWRTGRYLEVLNRLGIADITMKWSAPYKILVAKK